MGRVARASHLPPLRALIVTCEHASNHLPARYRGLGLTREALTSHIAWDAGARRVARKLARRFGCPYHEGRHSRLLIDLNRSPHHPKLVPRVAFGVHVPGNRVLLPGEMRRRIDRYYRPYREAVVRDIESLLARDGICCHLSVHSFAPILNRRERSAEVGILYDPAVATESELAGRMVSALRSRGLHVRRNYPYRGISDGMTTFCRRLFSERAYAGLELELNQRLLSPGEDQKFRSTLISGLEEALRPDSPPPAI